MSESIDTSANKTLDIKYAWKDYYLGIQAIFYFFQGASFAAIFMIAVFLQEEHNVPDNDALFYQTLFLLPWLLKVFLGLLSDNVSFKKFGRRRPYIFFGVIIGIFGWFGFALLETFNFLNIILAFLLTSSVAIVDTVFDSLGIDITPAHRRSAMQGVGWGFRGLGGALSGIIFGVLVEKIGWSPVYMIFGTLLIIGSFTCLIIPEPTNHLGEIKGSDIKWKDLKNEFTKKTTIISTVFNILGGSALAIVTVMNTFLNQEFGISITDIGMTFSIFAIGQFFGAISIGFITSKFSISKVMIIVCSLYGSLILFFLFDPFVNLSVIYLIIGIMGALNGSYETIQMRISMEFSVGKLSGTMYSWFNSMANLGQLALGAQLINIVELLTNNYLISMQVATIFIFLSIFPGLKLIQHFNSLRSNNIQKSIEDLNKIED